MKYLSVKDLEKGIRGEVLQVITRDASNAEQAIEEAAAEVESYLSARYNIGAELSKTPPDPEDPEDRDDRITMVVKIVRDIALYNCYNIANPANIPDNRIKSYENAIKFLRDCQAEKAAITQLARLNANDDGTTSSSYINFGGNEKREFKI
jgi:phage gp36-like protein